MSYNDQFSTNNNELNIFKFVVSNGIYTVTFAEQPEINYIYYLNGLESIRCDGPFYPGYQITMNKNSIIYISATGYTEDTIYVTDGQIVTVDFEHIVIAIYGDCTLTLL